MRGLLFQVYCCQQHRLSGQVGRVWNESYLHMIPVQMEEVLHLQVHEEHYTGHQGYVQLHEHIQHKIW